MVGGRTQLTHLPTGGLVDAGVRDAIFLHTVPGLPPAHQPSRVARIDRYGKAGVGFPKGARINP